MPANIFIDLYRHFHNYEYRLSNTFVYDWESDFFAMSKSRYFVEVEVKVSRGDYFRDFDKPKHNLFKDVVAGKTHHITHQKGRGDFIGRMKIGKLLTSYGEDTGMGRRMHWASGRKNGKWGYWVNDYGHTSIQYYEQQMYAPATMITVRKADMIKCPNQLYFACPDNLVKVEEIPPYAGLLYQTEAGIKLIKKAPYIHKRKQDLDKVLLKKFYNLWQSGYAAGHDAGYEKANHAIRNELQKKFSDSEADWAKKLHELELKAGIAKTCIKNFETRIEDIGEIARKLEDQLAASKALLEKARATHPNDKLAIEIHKFLIG